MTHTAYILTGIVLGYPKHVSTASQNETNNAYLERITYARGRNGSFYN